MIVRSGGRRIPNLLSLIQVKAGMLTDITLRTQTQAIEFLYDCVFGT